MALMPLILYRDSYNAWLLLLFTKPEYRPVIVCVCRIQQHNAGTSHFGNRAPLCVYSSWSKGDGQMNPSGIPVHNCPGNPPPSSTCFNQERHFLGRKLTFRIESLLFEHKVHFQSMKPTFLTSIPWYLHTMNTSSSIYCGVHPVKPS